LRTAPKFDVKRTEKNGTRTSLDESTEFLALAQRGCPEEESNLYVP